MLEDGSVDVGIGRSNRRDDDKGLPDGVVDEAPWHIQMEIGTKEERMGQRGKIVILEVRGVS
jgi:hypothetical protein